MAAFNPANDLIMSAYDKKWLAISKKVVDAKN
jgi:hypothetical protein